MARLTEDDKKVIIELNKNGAKPSFISKQLGNIPASTVRDFIKRYKKTGSLKNTRIRKGKVTPEISKFIEQYTMENRSVYFFHICNMCFSQRCIQIKNFMCLLQVSDRTRCSM